MKSLALIIIVAAVFALPVFATELQSNSYKILDPVIDVSAGRATSSRFQLLHAGGQTAIGQGTSSGYILRAGFLYFPEASLPRLTMTDLKAGRVLFEWTDSLGALGWTIASYDICYGTVSNTYSCRALGNVLRYVLEGLSTDTQYFFRVRARDVFGNIVVRSGEVTLTPARGGGGGVGAGGAGQTPPPAPVQPPQPAPEPPPTTTLSLQGLVYPESRVTIFQDSRPVISVEAGADASFEAILSDLQPGVTYVLGIQAQDREGRRSATTPLTVTLPETDQITITDIFVPPTARVSAQVLAAGQLLRLSGQTFPGATISAQLLPPARTFTVVADQTGAWTLGMKTEGLKDGRYAVLISSSFKEFQSVFPQAITFEIRAKPPAEELKCSGADLNSDGKVNLVDFSTLLFFWKKTNPANLCADINKDGIVDLKDFSILLSQWTG